MEKLKIKFILISVVLVFTASCDKQDDYMINSDNSISQREIFEGIFFGTGEIAKRINSIDNKYVEHILNNLTEKEKEVFENFKTDVYELLIKNKKNEFDNFISIMKSGDNELISNELVSFSQTYINEISNSKKYGEYFNSANDIMSKIKKEDLLDSDGKFNQKKFDNLLTEMKERDKESIALPVACFTMIVWNAGVVLNVAAAVNVVVGVNIGVLCYVGAGDDCFSKQNELDKDRILEREFLINDISVSLYEKK